MTNRFRTKSEMQIYIWKPVFPIVTLLKFDPTKIRVLPLLQIATRLHSQHKYMKLRFRLKSVK